MYRIFLLSTLLLLTLTSSFTQSTQVASAVHSQHIIKSQAVGEDRAILVRAPANYERSETRFPVIYMLDAHAPHNSMMAGMDVYDSLAEAYERNGQKSIACDAYEKARKMAQQNGEEQLAASA